MVRLNLRKSIINIVITMIAVFSFCSASYAWTIKIDEITTTKGKVITGLTKRETVKRFGLPYQASEKFWYYHKPEKFWVYFKESAKLTSISILPKSIEVQLNQPVMFKAIGEFSDFTSKDISDQVQWMSADEEIAEFVDNEVMLPRSLGTTQALALKNGIISTSAELNVAKAKEEGLPEKEKEVELISLDIVPQNPRVSLYQNKLTFKALGTFKDNETNKYFIKDISDDVVWQSEDEGKAGFEDNVVHLDFSRIGETEIFCSKDGIVSPVQTLSVLNITPVVPVVKLESITVLPRTIIIEKRREAKFKAFGTYNDADVKEITSKVNWKVKNPKIAKAIAGGRIPKQRSEITKIAKAIGKGKFLTRQPGITEVEASLDRISSEPRKLVVLGKPSRLKEFEQVKEKEKKKPSPSIDEVKEQIGSLKEQIAAGLRRELKSIQISPLNPEVSLGANLQFRAKGEYTDGSFRDLTSQVKWRSSNYDVATIEEDGVAQSKSIGVSLVTSSLDKVRSNSQKLTVVGPELSSISIVPENPTLAMNQTVQFEAQGSYTDETTRIITSEVDWVSYDQDIVRFGHRGKLKPQKAGKVEVSAKYEDLESLPQLVTVISISTMGALWMSIWRALGLILLGGIIFLSIMYLRRRRIIQRLKELMHRDPRSFVIRLYNNLADVLALYGTVRRKSMPPGEYTRLVKENYTEKDIDNLVTFSKRFNKARYSSHSVDQKVAHAAADEYDVIIACVIRLHRLRSNFIRYCRIVIKRLPLKISR